MSKKKVRTCVTQVEHVNIVTEHQEKVIEVIIQNINFLMSYLNFRIRNTTGNQRFCLRLFEL